jgi:UDP-2,3-diacylglucosamine hydrolase
MARNIVYFVSDAHLGAPFKDAALWEKQLIGFFRSISESASALYIIGDLFDFWIEYHHAIRADYFPVVHELRNLVEKGVEIHYFAGNHDFAFGPFITRTLGIVVHTGHEEFDLQGRHFHLYHGDGLLRFDVGYRLLKSILRNRINQTLYKLLPPGLGIGLATLVSGTSRKCSEGFMNEKIVAEYREHARAYLDNGNDIVIFGHSHRAELSRWPDAGGKIYCNTGAWMRHYNFATLTDGNIRLWRYRGLENPEEIAPIDRTLSIPT